jgi:hypothetical protein
MCALLAAGIAYFNNAQAETIILAIGSFFGFLHEFGNSGNALALNATTAFRNLFRRGDRLARALIITIAVGGSALVVDQFYPFSWVPDVIDPLIKRASIPLVVTACLLYSSSLISNRVRVPAHTHSDRVLLGYELCFYASCMALALCTWIFWLGFPIENCIQSSAKDALNLGLGKCLDLDAPTRPTGIGKLDGAMLKLMLVLCFVSFVWYVGFLLCLLSRYFQWRWTEAPQSIS